MCYLSLLVFLYKVFKFQSSVCNGCHDVLMMYINIFILNIHDVDCRCIIVGINKTEVMNLLRNADLSENSGSLWIIKKLSCIV